MGRGDREGEILMPVMCWGCGVSHGALQVPGSSWCPPAAGAKRSTCCAVPEQPVPCHTVLYRAIPCCTVPSCAVPLHPVPSRAMLCHPVPYPALPCRTVPYHPVPYHTLLCHAVLSSPTGTSRAVQERRGLALSPQMILA